MIEKILRIFTMYQFQLFFTYMYMYFLTKSKKMDANYNLGQTLFSDIAFDLELKASQFYFLSISLIIVVKLTGYKTCLLCAILIFMFLIFLFIFFLILNLFFYYSSHFVLYGYHSYPVYEKVVHVLFIFA